MPSVDTTILRTFLAEHIGEKISNQIYAFANTPHWLFLDSGNVVAMEDAHRNELYIFDTCKYLMKFVENNSWTYDVILDFDSASSVYYVEDKYNEDKVYSHMVVGNVSPDDAMEIYYRLYQELMEDGDYYD